MPHFVNDTIRTRILMVQDNKILLCRSWLSSGKWNIPGGGKKKYETPKQAAVRELYEEVDIKLDESSLLSLGSTEHANGNIQFSVELLHAEVANVNARAKWPEIVYVEWFALDSLPEALNSDAREAIKRYKQDV